MFRCLFCTPKAENSGVVPRSYELLPSVQDIFDDGFRTKLVSMVHEAALGGLLFIGEEMWS